MITTLRVDGNGEWRARTETKKTMNDEYGTTVATTASGET